ncbi:MAG TPA: hypothetical protein DCQ98_00410 [Planctomycetaceae bacterium]|nr:hypothetical protein [Planctomycetaceae bacterium]
MVDERAEGESGGEVDRRPPSIRRRSGERLGERILGRLRTTGLEGLGAHRDADGETYADSRFGQSSLSEGRLSDGERPPRPQSRLCRGERGSLQSLA